MASDIQVNAHVSMTRDWIGICTGDCMGQPSHVADVSCIERLVLHSCIYT